MKRFVPDEMQIGKSHDEVVFSLSYISLLPDITMAIIILLDSSKP